METDEANKIIAEFMGKRLMIKDRKGWKSTSVKQIIPMKSGSIKNPVYDVEILTNKTKNYYFSISMFKEGKSWVKEVKVSKLYDDRLTRAKPIAGHIDKNMCEDDYIATAKAILELK